MPEWARDAGLIAAVATLINIVTGRFGSGVAWIFARLEARKSVRVLQETIELKNQELAMNDRIIADLTAELDRRDRQKGGGT